MPSPMLNYADWELTPEQQMIQSVVREFVERDDPPDEQQNPATEDQHSVTERELDDESNHLLLHF